jgi:hypothetical protein
MLSTYWDTAVLIDRILIIVSCYRYMPPVLNDQCVRDMVSLLLVIVCSSNYISNPYLVAKMVEVMFVVNPAVQQNTRHLCEMMLDHQLAADHLVPALMNFYTGETEIRGLHIINLPSFIRLSVCACIYMYSQTYLQQPHWRHMYVFSTFCYWIIVYNSQLTKSLVCYHLMLEIPQCCHLSRMDDVFQQVPHKLSNMLSYIFHSLWYVPVCM